MAPAVAGRSWSWLWLLLQCVLFVAVRAEAQSRRLPSIEVFEGWTFPSGTTISLGSLLSDNAFGNGASASIELTALAGHQYTSLQILVPSSYQFDVQHTSAAVRLVLPVATAENCYFPAFAVPTSFDYAGETSTDVVEGPLLSGSGMSVILDNPPISLTASTEWPHLIFMKGGEFALCYAADGVFEGSLENAMLPITLRVIGVTAPCSTDDCLMEQYWDCYFSHRAELQGPCRFDFGTLNGRAGWGVISTGSSRVWWTSEWGRDTASNTGTFVPATQQRCSQSRTGAAISPETARYVDSGVAQVSGLALAALLPAVLPQLRTNESTSSFTLTACYCPNFDDNWDEDEVPCSYAGEFIQPMGVLRYWLLRLCDPTTYAGCGVLNPPYMRVLPQHPFVLRVECPPGGFCNGTSANRFRIVDRLPDDEEELSSWSSDHHCKISAETLDASWVPLPVGDFVEVIDNYGGDRRDYKFQRLSVNVSVMGGKLDVCYCDADCENLENYIKVGTVQTVTSLGLSRWTRDPDGSELVESMRYAGKSGSMTLYSGLTSPIDEDVHPHDGAPFTVPALVKFFQFDRGELFSSSASPTLTTFEKLYNLDTEDVDVSAELGAACASMPFSGEIIQSFTSTEEAKIYMAWVDPEGAASQRLPFSGPENDQFMRPLQAGVLVVCYCSILDQTDACAEDRYWMPAAKIMIRGPAGTTSIELPTNVNVRLDIEGWGFAQGDVLRLIGEEQSCTENANQPRGSTGYKIGCPGVNGISCRIPGSFEDIPTIVDTAASTGIFIELLEMGERNTTLTFNGTITDILTHGDGISIDIATILLEGRNNSQWTDAERFIVARFSGSYPFLDDTAQTHLLWLKVAYVYVNGVLQTNKLSINAGLPSGSRPVISFLDSAGGWVRHNSLRTNEDIRAIEENNLQICFSPLEESGRLYYSSAGVVSFRNPQTMTSAGVHLTVWQEFSKAPVVITFTPTQGNSIYRQYDAPIALRLLFRDTRNKLEPLLAGDISNSLQPLDPNLEVARQDANQVWCGRLFTEMWSNDEEGFPLPRGCYFGPQYEDMAEFEGGVGDLYREYFILFEPGNGLKDTCRHAGTGDNGACVYMLVLNAYVKQVQDALEDLVGIYPMCIAEDGQESICGNNRYQILEYGAGLPHFLTLPLSADAPRLSRLDVAMDSSMVGNTAPQTTDQELDGQRINSFRVNTFQFRAWVQNSNIPIQRSAQLRVYLRPLTLWDLGVGGCRAVCIPPDGVSCDDNRGGNESVCRREPVVVTFQDGVVQAPRNVVQLTYPPGMDSIPSTMADAQILQVSDLRLPDWGFYPTKFIAQLTDSSEENPSWVLSDRSFFAVPAGTTVGRLLVEGQAGSGPRPFAGDRFNELVARLVLGASLRHTGQSALTPPIIELTLPTGYACSVLGDGYADPDGTRELFQRDQNTDGYPDYFRSTVRSGTWTASLNKCTLTMSSEGVIFAGQAFYVLLNVDNPPEPLFRDDPWNIWLLTAEGMDGYALGPTVPFLSLQEEANYLGWAGNMAVLATLEIAALQPSVFAAGATNTLSVVFRSVHDTPPGSYVLLDAPDGFEFGANCIVSDMDPEFYVDWRALPWGADRSGDRSVTRSLGTPQSCNGSRWQNSVFAAVPTSGFTRASIKTSIRMQPNMYYAFRIEVQNALTYFQDHHDSWSMWVYSSLGYPIDGTKYSITFNMDRVNTLPANVFDRSWSIFALGLQAPLALEFSAVPVLPTSVQRVSAHVSVYSFLVLEDTQTSVRVTAPTGYEWDVTSPGGFIGTAPCPGHTQPATPHPCVASEVCIIDVMPIIPTPNELVLPGIVFRGGLPYGFCARLVVPGMPSTRSANDFFFELGYDGTSLAARHQAGAVPAPPLAAIYNAEIRSLCNAAEYASNEVEFHLTISSELRTNAGFVFMGDENTRGMRIACWPEPVEDSLRLPPDAQCSVFEDSVNGLPVIVLSATSESIAPGVYGFRFHGVGNPWLPTSTSAFWTMGTYQDVHLYPNMRVQEMARDVPAQRVLPPLQMAGLLQPPQWEALQLGYDTRPSYTNSLIFYFRLNSRPLAPPEEPHLRLALRAPLGFEFEEDCINSVRALNRQYVSNLSLPNNTWPCDASNRASQQWCPIWNGTELVFAEWNQDRAPVVCLGIENSALLLVPNRLFEARTTYAFQIDVRNGIANANTNSWALDFHEEASRPFASFDVTTFNVNSTSVHLAAWSASTLLTDGSLPDSAYSLVQIEFEPSLEVPMIGYQLTDPTYGTLVIEAPSGYAFKMQGGGFALDALCAESEMTLEVSDRVPWDDESLLLVPADMVCTPLSSSRIELQLTGLKPLYANTRYTFIVPVANPSAPTPPGYWLLSTVRYETGTGRVVPLDEISIQGVHIANAMTTWAVDNDSGEFRGGFKVWVVSFTIGLSANIYYRDNITVTAPPGFDLLPFHSGAAEASCDNFVWSTVIVPLPNTSAPYCHCTSEQQCGFTFDVVERGNSEGIVRAAGQNLEFQLSLLNPSLMPTAPFNLWRVEHRSFTGDLKASSSVESWEISTQLRNLSLAIVGIEKRAGATTILRLEFNPVNWGDTLAFSIRQPAGFDFTSARVDLPLLRDPRTTAGTLVLIGGDFVAGITHEILVEDVVLGSGGGQTIVDLHLYAGALMVNEVGQRLNFLEGFRLPGNLRVLAQRLHSFTVVRHYEFNETDAVLPSLRPRLESVFTNTRLARFQFFFAVSRAVAVGEVMTVRCLPEDTAGTPHTPIEVDDLVLRLGLCTVPPTSESSSFYSSPLQCEGYQSVHVDVGFTTLADGVTRDGWILQLGNLTGDRNAPVLTTDVLGPSGRSLGIYLLEFWVIPSQSSCRWRFTTEDGEVMPTNTNDDMTTSATAVAGLALQVLTPRGPPSSELQVDLVVSTDSPPTPFTRLEILMPAGFQALDADIAPGILFGAGRRLIRLPLETLTFGEEALTLEYSLRVLTPEMSPADARWFVLASAEVVVVGQLGNISIVANDPAGWGSDPGFEISALDVDLKYAPLLEFTGWLAIAFSVPRSAGGRYAVLVAPEGLALECKELPKDQPAECTQALQGGPHVTEASRTVNLTLQGGQTLGTHDMYSYVISFTTPAEDPNVPLSTIWEIYVIDGAGKTVDANLNHTGPEWNREMDVETPTLVWVEDPFPKEISTARLEVTFTLRAQGVKSILFSLPETFRHYVIHPNQIRSLTQVFPVAVGLEWRNYDNLRWIRILIDDSESAVDFIPSGTYEFEFPVMLPEALPQEDEWYFSLCSNYFCENPFDEHTMVTFTIPNPSRIMDLLITKTSSSRWRSSPGTSSLIVVALSIVSMLVGAPICSPSQG